ncbi:three-helix bundle dimerization domain-containing protein [Amycolatopsis sp. NPDC051903]|uniref:three-helix bundle dimerization domain-containing protein n=1 Tax=Amycolatopsis sp. NPDC051903 TaxID=3363936 RepID=UPI0037B2EDED
MQEQTVGVIASEHRDSRCAHPETRPASHCTTIDPSVVRDRSAHERSRFAGARIHAHLPVFVERAAKSALELPGERHGR